tara:strand:+ start:1306 stop:1497 length:192 start_codon:yes stop_codon:yes gene_type:complete
MKKQMQLFCDTKKHSAGKYHAFLVMAFDPIEPLTKRELVANIKRNPSTWKCFENWLEGDKLAE